MSTKRAFLAATRFGLGVSPGQLESIAKDPRRWLLRQMTAARGPEGPSSTELLETMRSDREDRDKVGRWSREMWRDAAQASLVWAATTNAPFAERMVRFYSNLLTVSVQRREVMALAGPFEQEAVRPNIWGRYEDLLLASTRHPAMLMYLDNFRSTGPDSRRGQRQGHGLNENLARELLELHTLGVNGGYDQDDVEALAALLTGWSIEAESGFHFAVARHQPGDKRLLGRRFPEGEQGCVEALRMLARHPSTARNVCTRLARHFLQDEPSPADIDLLVRAWGDGELSATARALVELDSCWKPFHKLRSPQELIIATARALPDISQSLMVHSATSLGQARWDAPSPKGWSDLNEDWAGPDAVLARVQWCQRSAARARSQDPLEWARSLFGPLLSGKLARSLEDVDAHTGMALVLASPEFQRR